MKKVLFVCYGGGHARMVIPVAETLRQRRLADVRVLALTTAAADVRQAGLPLLQFKDFIAAGDVAALTRGRELARDLAHVVDAGETQAYLGLSWADLEAEHGPQQAARLYATSGRQAFLPVPTLRRVLQAEKPDLVVATSSPRAERAAILAARSLGLPSVCMVDMFCTDEVAWVGQPGYADRVCVLNEEVRAFLLRTGREAADVVATGNPAFDSLNAPTVVAQGRALRAAQGWQDRDVVLWASQPEPLTHPSVPGRSGDPLLPNRILQALLAWQQDAARGVLVVRPHPSENPPQAQGGNASVCWDGRQFPLHPLLHAVDAVVTMNSTVGIEGHLAGRRVVQVLGSLFDDSAPLARFGMATACEDPSALAELLPRVLRSPPPTVNASAQGAAADAVVEVLKEFLR